MFLTLALVLGQPVEVVNKCPVVVNKCPKSEPLVYPHGYPVHPTRWTYPGEIHAHLKSGQHAGKWPAVWIDTLSRRQAESLHDDDHEGKVDWRYVPQKPVRVAVPTPTAYIQPSFCPTGSLK